MLKSQCLSCLKNTLTINPLSINSIAIRNIFTSLNRRKAEDRREMLASMPAKDEGTQGEKALDIDNLLIK